MYSFEGLTLIAPHYKTVGKNDVRVAAEYERTAGTSVTDITPDHTNVFGLFEHFAKQADKIVENMVLHNPHGDYDVTYGPAPTNTCNLFLVKGSTSLTKIEKRLSAKMAELDLPSQEDPDVVSRHLGAFRRNVLNLCRKHSFEVVLLDLGPAASTTNMVLCLSCDAILPPVFAESFSVTSVEGLINNVLPLWVDERAKLMKMEHKYKEKLSATADFLFNPALPKLLPFVVNNFRLNLTKGRVEALMVMSDAAWVNLLDDLVNADLGLTAAGFAPKTNLVKLLPMLLVGMKPGDMVVPLLETTQARRPGLMRGRGLVLFSPAARRLPPAAAAWRGGRQRPAPAQGSLLSLAIAFTQ